MLKSTVTCWFCHNNSQVFIWNRNSWTCANCEQYNGFKKDGDYNRDIPEMTRVVSNKKYCATNGDRSANGDSSRHPILCDRCNRNQELKLEELKKFEATLNDKSDHEYDQYKKNLDHVYDLCRPCKTRLNNHLRLIDSQIGESLLRQRSVPVAQPAIRSNLLKPDGKVPKLTVASGVLEHNGNGNGYHANGDHTTKTSFYGLNDLCDNFKSTFKKAYTIAGGSVPSKMIRESNSMNKWASRSPTRSSPPKKKPVAIEETDEEVRKPSSTETRSITCASFLIVLEDFFIYACLWLVFACDLVNLLNDSGVLMNNTNTNNEWFQTLLGVYKHTPLVLIVIIASALHLTYKRPKMNRVFMIVGFVFDLIVHVNFFELTHEEQFILESFVSFFLLAYLSMARVYNLFQLVRYVGLI